MSADKSPDLEFSVLARMVWDNKATSYFADVLQPSDFLSVPARTLFSVLANSVTLGKPTDPVSLSAQARMTQDPDVLALVEMIVSTDILSVEFDIGMEELADAFRSWSYAERFREIIKGCDLALSQRHPIEKIEARLEQRLTSLQSGVSRDRVYDDAAKQTDEVLEFLDQQESEKGMTWGLRKLDNLLVPPRPGNLILLGGPTGAGKSTVARNLYAGWVQRRWKVAVFSPEMSSLECRVNLACQEAGIDVLKVWRKNLTPDERERFEKELAYWKTAPVRINDRGHLTPSSLLRTMARYHALGCKVFVIDHLHRIDYGEAEQGDLRIPMGNLARDLKTFAMQHKVVILALVQLKKMAIHDEPDESSIRETNKLAEECDAALYVYRPLVAGEQAEDGTTRPLIAPDGGRFFKNNAPKGSVMTYDPENVYVKSGKTRIRPPNAVFRVPFNAGSGKMYDQ